MNEERKIVNESKNNDDDNKNKKKKLRFLEDVFNLKNFLEASFLSGIPIFGFLSSFQVYNIEASPKIYVYIVGLFISSVLCALSILILDMFQETENKNYIDKRLYLYTSLLILFVSMLISSLFSPILTFFPIIIYLNWNIYYKVRKIVEFPDIVLHLTGGVIQFFFGVCFAEQINGIPFFKGITQELTFLSLFVSFAFSGGYISDLIEDVQEDINIGQKNIVVKIGEHNSLKLSFLFFLIGYIFAVAPLSQNIIPKWGILSALLTHFIFFLFTSKSKINIRTYRMIYRAIFIYIGVIFVLHNFPV